MTAKRMFFDSAAVTRGVDRTTRRVFSKFGAYVRRSAKSSIRKRKRTSASGKPPSSHLGLLKKMIYFSYDRGEDSVVIGPQALHGKHYRDALPALEYGGMYTREVRDRKTRRWSRRRVRYKARPFMGPAFEKEKPKLPSMWRDSIR